MLEAAGGVEVSPARLRRMLWRFIGVVAAVMAVLSVAGFAFKAELEASSRAFVAAFGPGGVFIGWLLADALPLPVPHDVISTAAVVGGLPFWDVVGLCSAGSLVGSTIGFAIGRYLPHTRPFAWVMDRYGAESRALAARYGVIALVIGAVTPVNYSICVWATGAMQLRWSQLFLVSWMRFPRVVVYLYLFTSVVEAAP